jgi:hypothetical protein
VFAPQRNAHDVLDDNDQFVDPNNAPWRRALDAVVLQRTPHTVDEVAGEVAHRAEPARPRVLHHIAGTAHVRFLTEVARPQFCDVTKRTALRMPRAALVAPLIADATDVHASVFTAVGLCNDFVAQRSRAGHRDARIGAVQRAQTGHVEIDERRHYSKRPPHFGAGLSLAHCL